eukprot:gene2885-9882_t
MHRPLGAPLGDFKNESQANGEYYLTRAFATGTKVVMNATGGDNRNTRDNFKCVYWSDGFLVGVKAVSFSLNDKLVLVHKSKQKHTLNQPIFTAAPVLDYAKLSLFKFDLRFKKQMSSAGAIARAVRIDRKEAYTSPSKSIN